MKIAIIRGPFLNPWELQSYIPLTEKHELHAVGSDWHLYAHDSLKTHLRVHYTPVWGEGSQTLHSKLPLLFNRIRSWTLGKSFDLPQLKRIAKGMDILHPAEMYSTMTYQCAQLKKTLGCRLVVTVWENLLHMGELHPWRKHCKQVSIAAADGILAVTETTRRMLLHEGVPDQKIHVIPMAVDLNHFTPKPRDPNLCLQLGIKETDLVILFVGRFVKEKGVLDILETIPATLSKAAGATVRFVFVGDGPLKADLLRAKERYRDNILIIPFRNYAEIPKIHNLADIFVLPSKATAKWQEQFGYVLIESMACAKPVVTTRSGSIPDVVGDAAILVEPNNSRSLQAGLEQVLDLQRRKQLGEKALQRAHALFGARTVAHQIDQLYQKAYGN